ncbi:MAG: DUF3084 domain-containing protein [Chlorobia bacterium]|nr:DUF3084 domain-containing protein [Fimbriimonadaceae bacterium]
MPNQTTDFIPYLFLAAMIVISGLVALVADGMGRKIGKKRLSFMGLRPRYTATLITVAAGILTSILTILAIYALSSDVREWIKEGRGAIQRARVARADADSSEKHVKELQTTEQVLKKSQANLTKQNAQQSKRLEEYRGKVAEANKQVTSAQAKATTLQGRVSSIQAKLALTNRQIITKQSEIATKQKLVEKGRKELAKVESNLNKASSQSNEVSQRNLQLVQRQQELEADLKKSEDDLSNLKTQKVEFEGQIDSYKQSVKAYQESIVDYSAKINQLQQDYESISNRLQTNIVASRTRPMIFEASQELARIQLPPSLSPVAAKNAFVDLLQRARTTATANKAINSPVSPSAGLTPREFNKRIVSIADQEDAIVRAITSQRTELVFIARSFFNAFEGEYVLLDFVVYRNRLVYSQGKMITEKRIDGRKSEVEILNQIQDFISTNVRTQALKDGMIPPSGRVGQLGNIGEEELLELIREAKSYDQLVRLQAFAKTDTNAGDKLELAFRVRP